MSITTIPTQKLSAPPDRGIRPRRWTREEYYRAAELGLFGPEEQLELLDGAIIEKMSPQKPLHAVAVDQASDVLARAFGAGHHTRVEKPLILTSKSEPEPDVVVVPGTRFDYLPDHPKASDARLVVEVADTTLRFDRGRKQTAYARSGVLEYWIINLLECQVEVYRNPSGARYHSATIYREPAAITPLAAPHAAVLVSDLLPPVSTEEDS